MYLVITAEEIYCYASLEVAEIFAKYIRESYNEAVVIITESFYNELMNK